MALRIACAIAISALSLTVLGASSQAPRTFPKHVLAWADVRNGYQHESITHALSTIERLGWESGLYDTIIRTDSQSITKSPILFRQGTGIASGEQFLARNLNYFDAIFFFGVREIDLDAASSAPTCCGSSATTARDLWRRMRARPHSSRGRNSARCWAAGSTSIRGASAKPPSIVEDRTSPITRHLPGVFAVTDEHYQLKDFSRKNVHVLARLDPAKLDLKAPLVHRTDRDFVAAYTKELRQRPRVLFHARPSARAVGREVAADRCISKR